MKYHKGNKVRKRAGTRVAIFVIAVIFTLVVVGAISARFWYREQLKPLSAKSSTVSIEIPVGYTPAQIGKLLQDKKVIKSARAFEWYVRNSDYRDYLQAGQYQLDASLSVPDVVNVIAQGKIQKNLFTILPSQRIDQIKAHLIKAGHKEAEINAALNPANYKNHPALVAKPTDASLEGYLYPESFQTTAVTTPKEIITQSLDQMAKALTPELIDQFTSQGLSIHKAITLASIVEQEVSKTADRKMVAGVFLNRLKIDMALGSDVTYHYAAAISDQEPTPFIDSPYNTRKYPGLPPGPISNVSKSSLEAVADPTPSEFLFFVAGDNGTTYYSKTAAEHEALAKEHCKKLCSTY